MTAPLPSLNWLRVFEAAARCESFARAAEELNMSAAAVSQQVRALEERLGAALFERPAHAVRLTDPGRAYLPGVQQAMLTLQPALIDAPGPHGFNLHFHAQVGLEQAKPVLDYLQSVMEIELRPNPIAERLREAAEKQAAGGTGGEAAGDDGDDG